MSIVEFIIVFVALALVSGFLSGLLGVGGGIVQVPIFVSLFEHYGAGPEISMQLAVGTALALSAPTAVAGGWKQYRLGLLDLRYFWKWGLYCVIGVLIAIAGHRFVPGFYLKIAYIVIIYALAVYIGFLKGRLFFGKERPRGWPEGLIAGGIGLFSALIGISGGGITGPLLVAYSYPLHESIALALATAGLVGTVGAVGAILNGLDATALPPVFTGIC